MDNLAGVVERKHLSVPNLNIILGVIDSALEVAQNQG